MTTVAHAIDGDVGVVTLSKPPHNLLDDPMIEDLRQATGESCIPADRIKDLKRRKVLLSRRSPTGAFD